MKRTTMALGVVLAFTAAARAETTDWPPQKEKESVFTDRKLETFKHGIRKEWGYAAPQRDTFLVLHPRQARSSFFSDLATPGVVTDLWQLIPQCLLRVPQRLTRLSNQLCQPSIDSPHCL